jgi:3-deoxy-manno-octulosonate cytidylyltransferase (CMP-KDO synthetase)
LKVVAVIPARHASTRFPGKPIAPILGRPMIQWVWERARRARGIGRVLVATDDTRIAEAARGFGAEAVMTSPSCPSGSDRVWEAVRDLECDVVLNLQGDEPALEPEALERLLDLMASRPEVELGTLVTPISARADYENPNVVKVVLGEDGRCLYFSRSPLPYLRGLSHGEVPLWRHVGVYAFRKAFLGRFVARPQGALERAEALEQLRALEMGALVAAAEVRWPGCAVDTPEDVAAAEAFLLRERQGG